jgi:alkylhydroperoxidase family enzyme
VLALNDPDLIQAALANWRSVPVTEPRRAMLGFLEKLTLHPSTLGDNDIQQLRDAGLSNQAVEEAIRVCFALTIVNRLADALDFEVPSDASTQRTARILFMAGYGRSSLRG